MIRKLLLIVVFLLLLPVAFLARVCGTIYASFWRNFAVGANWLIEVTEVTEAIEAIEERKK